VLEGEQVGALGMIQTYQFPRSGEYQVLGSPIRLDHVALDAPKASPELGGDTVTILEGIGFERAAIDELRSRAVVGFS